MTDSFEARERSFYVTGEMTEFDVAAIHDYLGKTGLRVIEKPLPVPAPTPEWIQELPEAERSEIFTKEDFNGDVYTGRGTGSIWKTTLKAGLDGRLPLELRRTVEGEVGITYRSAASVLELFDSPDYTGYRSTHQAHGRLVDVVRGWLEAQREQ